MKITLECFVPQSVSNVFDRFDRDLFLALKPPLLPMGLKRFDGCKVGDEVHIQMGPTLWISLITENQVGPSESFFVDEGKQLPFPLTYWRHKHIIRQMGNGSVIIDDIEFRSFGSALDFLLKPILWGMFKLRHPVYRSYFKE